HGVLQALAGLDEARDRRVAALRPVRLAPEQAAVAVGDEDDDRRIDPREDADAAVRPDAHAGVAARLRARQGTATAAVLLRLVPDDQRPCLGDEVRLVDRQGVAEVAQVVELADVLEGRVARAVDLDREGRSPAIHAEENRLRLAQPWLDVLAGQEHGPERLAGGEALVAPNGDEHRVCRRERRLQPCRVLAAMPGAVDEGAREDVVSVHGSPSLSIMRMPAPAREVYRNPRARIRRGVTGVR